MADFMTRAEQIFTTVDRAPGFLGRPEKVSDGPKTFTPNDDYGAWGFYAIPLALPGLAGRPALAHIATLSLWQDTDSARRFVYRGLHQDALKIRHDWFLKGPWPGHVLWTVEAGIVPSWAEGVSRIEALAREGEAAAHFTFGSRLSHA